jgi:hypothetical protein
LDSERGRGEAELRGEAAERPATDPPRVDPVGDAADDAWTPRRAGSGVTRGRVGAEEEAVWKRVSAGAQGERWMRRNKRSLEAEGSTAAR